jgi:hypothetical protein
MPITRINLETVLIGRIGPMFTAVGLDGTTTNGTNAALVDPIRSGLASLSLAPAIFATITDADLALVADRDTPQLIDVAELQARRNALDASLDVDEQVDRDGQKLSQLATRWEKRIETMEARLRLVYGIGLSSLIAGTINLGFAEQGDLNGGFD